MQDVKLFPDNPVVGKCPQAIQHKCVLIHPDRFREAGIMCSRIIQRVGDLMITYPGAHHFGYNTGYNIAEATNYSTREWYTSGAANLCWKAGKCNCKPIQIRTSSRQLAVSSALTRLGYSPKLEVPIFNGVVTTDIVIEMMSSPSSSSSSSSLSLSSSSSSSSSSSFADSEDKRLIKVSIEFDGPTHYLRPMIGSRDLVGPIDGKTRLRNTLLKKCGLFERLITIPYYDWNKVQGNKVNEEEYLKKKIEED